MDLNSNVIGFQSRHRQLVVQKLDLLDDCYRLIIRSAADILVQVSVLHFAESADGFLSSRPKVVSQNLALLHLRSGRIVNSIRCSFELFLSGGLYSLTLTQV